MLLTDGYKLDHRRQYPNGTEFVYANWTPRSNEHLPEAKDGCVVFGIQYFIKKYLIEAMNKDFFAVDEETAVKSFKRRIDTYKDWTKESLPANVTVFKVDELNAI